MDEFFMDVFSWMDFFMDVFSWMDFMDVSFRDVASSITTSVIGTPARRRGIGRLETGSWWL